MNHIKNFRQYLNEALEGATTKLYDLIKYLEADHDDKIQELPEFFDTHYPEVFSQWIADEFSNYAGDFDEDEDEFFPDSIPTLHQYPAAYAAYCAFLYKISQLLIQSGENPYNLEIHLLPPFITISYEGDVDEEWLVHFSHINAVNAIIESGYFEGVPSIDNLAITATNNDDWTPDGYAFAYHINDTFYNFDRGYVKYSTDGVLFKAMGVKVYHNGDDELQVIFIGNTASEMVGFYQDEEDEQFYTLDKSISAPTFEEFKEMVIAES